MLTPCEGSHYGMRIKVRQRQAARRKASVPLRICAIKSGDEAEG
jgi:hypothetical protein